MRKPIVKVLTAVLAVMMIFSVFSVMSASADVPENNFGPNTPISPDDNVLFLSIEAEAVFVDGRYQYHKVSATPSGGVAPYTYSYALDGIMSDYSTSDFKYMFLGENKTYDITVNVKDNMGTVCSSQIQCVVDFHATADETNPDVPQEGYTVYVDAKDNTWRYVSVYVWDEETGEEALGLWPGKKCKQLDNGMWEAFIPNNCTNVMFSIDGGQSNALEAPKDTNVAVYKGMDEHDDYIFEWEFSIPTDPTEPTITTEITEPTSVAPDDFVKVYFENTAGFEKVYAYTWTDEGVMEFGNFPGKLCTYEGGEIWSVDLPKEGNVVFSDGANINYTNNLINPDNTMTAKCLDADRLLYDWFDYVPEINTTVTEPQESSSSATNPSTSSTDPTEAPSSVVTEPTEPVITTEATEPKATTSTEPSEITTTTATVPATSEPEEVPTVPATDDQAGTNRYYFYRPAFWLDNEYSDTVGIYWWEGTDACKEYPGYEAKKADVEGVYYYDVPKDVTEIVWNNFFDGGYDPEADTYNCAYRISNGSADFYEPGDCVLYPDGVESFDGMIYICTPYAPVSGHYWEGPVSGEWYYYYGNGEYGITREKGDEFYTCSFQTNNPTSASFDETLIPFTGDVNDDGKLNIRDVTLIQKYLAKIETFYNYAIGVADYNLDYKVNIKDATTIQKKLANII